MQVWKMTGYGIGYKSNYNDIEKITAFIIITNWFSTNTIIMTTIQCLN